MWCSIYNKESDYNQLSSQSLMPINSYISFAGILARF